MSKLTKGAFHSEPAAFEYLEATLWPEDRKGEFASHDRVDHAKDEYVRYEGDKVITAHVAGKCRLSGVSYRNERHRHSRNR
jgi:hypothetical protein